MVTREEISKIANLSKLYFKDEELDSFATDMTQIVRFADDINKAQVNNSNFDEADDINEINNALREDVIIKSFNKEDILKNVQGGKDGFFYIKKFN